MPLTPQHQLALIALSAHVVPRVVANRALAEAEAGRDVERILREEGRLGLEEIAALRRLVEARTRTITDGDRVTPARDTPDGGAGGTVDLADPGEAIDLARSRDTVVLGPDETEAGSPGAELRAHVLTRAMPPRYVPIRTIGQGGVGVVFSARDPDLGREIAMKVLRRGARASPRQRDRFLREARLTGRLEHPNIIPVYDYGELEGGDPYFTMRLIKGRTLAEVLRAQAAAPPDREPEFPRTRLLQIFQAICMGVAYAHDHGVIHRDLKPDNVILGDYGEVLILDWGLAKSLGEHEEAATGAIPEGGRAHVTLDGTVVGTPAYMSPEQAEGRVSDVDEKTDLYALGAILYEILTLAPPFEGDDARTVVDRVAQGAVVPPRVRAPARQVPQELEEICLRALAREKAQRPASARALHDEVLHYLEGARERGRRRREAEAALTAGREIAKRYFAVKDVLGRYAELRDQIAAKFEGHEPVEQKKELWAIEDQIEQMVLQRSRRFADAVRKLASVLEIEADHPTARRELAELYWDRFLEAEAANDRTEMDYAIATVKFYNDGSLDDRIAGDGSLAITTDPPGAEVYCYEYAERDRVLVPEWGRPLGPSPIARFRLPMGSYLLHIRQPGCRDVRRPVFITRQRELTLHVRCYADAQIGPDFVQVPGGRFVYGGDSKATSHRPKVRLDLPEFFIGRTPITAAEYCAFLEALPPAEAEARAPRTVGVAGPLWDRGPDGRWRLPALDPRTGFAWQPDFPALGVSWEDATAYAAWRSARDGRRYELPTEEQWEKAARGVDGRFYPWGDKFDPTYCKNSRSRPGEARPEAVAVYAEDESPYGVRDMAGGVREWCATRAKGKADVCHLRGGSWLHGSTAARVCSRAGDMRNAALFIYGFRLVTTELLAAARPAAAAEEADAGR